MKYITALHGNEYLPTIALANANIPQIVGNPKAIAENKRFMEKDLNAAFGTNGKTYEESRARELLDLIPEHETVIDFHTTTALGDPFAIIVDESMTELAMHTGLKHIVWMKYNIKDHHALINYRKGISVEYGPHLAYSVIQTTLNIVKNLESGKKHSCILYEVYGKIDEAGDYSNFKLYNDEFYPILAGEESYDFYGLKARKIRNL